MREIDRIMVEDLHVDLIQMMENAGRHLADLAITLFSPKAVLVMAGVGGNGGGGLAAARHLSNRGVDVSIAALGKEHRMAPVTARQLQILDSMGIGPTEKDSEVDVIVDALLGYSLRGDPRAPVAELIDWANQQPAPILSLDLPSGLDATTGDPAAPCIDATATMTLALPKSGLFKARSHVGRLYLADIAVPPPAYRRIGIEAPAVFASDTILSVE